MTQYAAQGTRFNKLCMKTERKLNSCVFHLQVGNKQKSRQGVIGQQQFQSNYLTGCQQIFQSNYYKAKCQLAWYKANILSFDPLTDHTTFIRICKQKDPKSWR
eukprot:scaffold74446_cov18-Prasinocladus_malaysianus.AAC.1